MKANTPSPPLLPQRFSLVAQTVQCLRQSILSGRWQKHLPGERRLCEQLQVGRDTLRAALEELQRMGWIDVSQRRRRRIKARRTARSASPQKKVIALLAPCSFLELSPTGMLLSDTLRNKLTEAGYVVEFHASSPCFSAQPARALEKLAHDHPAAAWMVFGSKEATQRWFTRHRLPCLVLGSCAPNIALPSFDEDYRAACSHAGGMLWRKGHRRIALVVPQDGYGGDRASQEGLSESLKHLTDARLQVLQHDGTTPHLCAQLDRVMRSPQPPTAFVVVRAAQALTVMMHLMCRGHRIPKDAAVISCADGPFLQFASPRVARYAIDPVHLTRRVSTAVRQLAETGTLEPTGIRIIPKFIPGETV